MMLRRSVISFCICLSPIACGSSSGSGPGSAGASAGGASSSGATGISGSASAGQSNLGGASSTAGATAAGGAGLGGAGTAGASAAGTSGAGGATLGGGGGAAGGGGQPAAGAGGAGGAGAAGTSGIGGAGGGTGGTGSASPMMNIFVTSDTSATANLGGLSGADLRCQKLAAAVGAGAKIWHAYLSAAAPLINARDRIGSGPYYNSKGVMLAATNDALHAIHGDHTLFITEKGDEINGQWNGSGGVGKPPNEHDILTGSTNLGMISTGNTCGDWTATTGASFVGHTDGTGPGMAMTGTYVYWAGSHTGMCGDTKPGGGIGRLYCFVAP